jgi:hypothetical protein
VSTTWLAPGRATPMLGAQYPQNAQRCTQAKIELRAGSDGRKSRSGGPKLLVLPRTGRTVVSSHKTQLKGSSLIVVIRRTASAGVRGT